ncbi:hypothetical protein MNEG_15465, partial [Monoraphidium neglectum]
SDVSRPLAAAVAAGAAHSCAVTRDGVLLAWRSGGGAAGQLAVHEVGGALAGRRVAAVSCGKTRTTAVTEEGDVFQFEGLAPGKDAAAAAFAAAPPGAAAAAAAAALLGTSPGAAAGGEGLGGGGGSFCWGSSPRGGGGGGGSGGGGVRPVRVLGVKHASLAAVGEKHTIVVQYWGVPALPADASDHEQMLEPPRAPAGPRAHAARPDGAARGREGAAAGSDEEGGSDGGGGARGAGPG